MRLISSLPVTLSLFFAAVLLTGCSTSFAPQPSTQVTQVGTLKGQIYGGRQPISGAQVYLYAAGTGGYGTASTSLLTADVLVNSPMNSGVDLSGNFYVTTNASGNFTITGDYTCTAGQGVYIYALGGDPGSGSANSGAGIMAALGICPSDGTFAGHIPYIYMSEVSTIAAAYALAPYATDATHIASSGTTQAVMGLTNAFLTAHNLYDITGANGQIGRSVTDGGNGVAPQAKIDSLADSLAACVNSDGPTGIDCSALFSDTTADGVTPTETATAAIQMAHHPTSNASDIFGLAASRVPFAPTLSTTPNDLSLAIQYTQAGLNNPVSVAVDGSGNVWAANAGNNTVTELTSLGAPISSSSGFTDGGISAPKTIAIDTNGNAYVTNSTGHSVTEILASGTAATGSPYSILSTATPYGLAIDGSNGLYVSDATPGAGQVLQLTNTGTQLATAGSSYVDDPYGVALDSSSTAWVANFQQATIDGITFTMGGFSDAQYYDFSLRGSQGVAIDSSGSKWVTDHTSNQLTVLNTGGNVVAYGGAGLNAPSGIAIDGQGTAWAANTAQGGSSPNTYYSVSAFGNGGSALTGSGGLQADSSLTSPQGIAVDPSGNVWVTSSSNALYEFVGAAAPVVTPTSSALGANTLATRP